MAENQIFSADELLRLCTNAETAAEYAEFLDLLIEKHALPVIETSLRAKFHEAASGGFYLSAQDFEDLRGESCLRLIEKLAAMRNSPGENSIRDFRAYVAVIAYNTWNKFLSDGAPHRKNLKNKIRYALGKSTELEIWRDGDEIYYGLKIRQSRLGQIAVEDLTARVREEFGDFRNAALPDLLFVILEKADSALKLDELVAIVAELWAVEDLPNVSLENFGENILPGTRNETEMHFNLEQIWREIRTLPVNQRLALLYNLRDENGREMLFMFFNHKIASLREIAETMNLSLEDCAEILPRLPLEDEIIAEKMNLTAKQVANLRKTARDNLRRRWQGKSKRKNRGNPVDGESETNEDGFGLDLTEVLD